MNQAVFGTKFVRMVIADDFSFDLFMGSVNIMKNRVLCGFLYPVQNIKLLITPYKLSLKHKHAKCFFHL